MRLFPEAGFPRMRGDVPIRCNQKWFVHAFSPHARGCSRWDNALADAKLVFPACAGMFLMLCNPCYGRTGFPRMRGDVPLLHSLDDIIIGFSPHARGCSQFPFGRGSGDPVFPACAGMFLSASCSIAPDSRFPRMRGDVPFLVILKNAQSQFSPHARGCSCSILATSTTVFVFPACAGMFPPMGFLQKIRDRFPRMRGDVPSFSYPPR